MKLFITFIVVLSCVYFINCGKDDKDDEKTPSIPNWKSYEGDLPSGFSSSVLPAGLPTKPSDASEADGIGNWVAGRDVAGKEDGTRSSASNSVQVVDGKLVKNITKLTHTTDIGGKIKKIEKIFTL